jgi:hypothetical protein
MGWRSTKASHVFERLSVACERFLIRPSSEGRLDGARGSIRGTYARLSVSGRVRNAGADDRTVTVLLPQCATA